MNPVFEKSQDSTFDNCSCLCDCLCSCPVEGDHATNYQTPHGTNYQTTADRAFNIGNRCGCGCLCLPGASATHSATLASSAQNLS